MRRSLVALAGVFLAAAFVTACGGESEGGGLEASAACQWRGSDLALPRGSAVEDIAVLSDRDVWAVGAVYDYVDFAPTQPLVVHWDGRALRRVPMRDLGIGFSAVSVISAEDVWVLAEDVEFEDRERGDAVMRWDGHEWTRMLETQHDLSDVLASAPDDVWVVGNAGSLDDESSQPLTWHWNGQRWQTIPVPIEASSVLNAISGDSETELWAVGVTASAQGEDEAAPYQYKALAIRWDGRGWRPIRLPASRYAMSSLGDVIVESPQTVWIFGWTGDGRSERDYPDAKSASYWHRWNGSSWRSVKSLDEPSYGLARVAQQPGGGFWGAGDATDFPGGSLGDDGIYRWHAGSWTRVATLPHPEYIDFLVTELASSATTIWAAAQPIGDVAPGSVLNRYVCGANS